MLGLGMPELIVIFLAVVLLFGARALPDIARGLAEAVKNFKKGMKEIHDEGEKGEDEKKNTGDK